jgi:hypothetical protein
MRGVGMLMRASWARETCNKVNNEKYAKYLEQLDEQVQKACSEGLCSVEMEMDVEANAPVSSLVRECGYHVASTEKYIIVSW